MRRFEYSGLRLFDARLVCDLVKTVFGGVIMKNKKYVPTFLALFVVLWPAFLWLFALLIAQLARFNGCTIWARGPEECLFLGADVGEYIYPLWALGFYLLYVFLWVPIGLILLGLIRLARRAA